MSFIQAVLAGKDGSEMVLLEENTVVAWTDVVRTEMADHRDGDVERAGVCECLGRQLT